MEPNKEELKAPQPWGAGGGPSGREGDSESPRAVSAPDTAGVLGVGGLGPLEVTFGSASLVGLQQRLSLGVVSHP